MSINWKQLLFVYFATLCFFTVFTFPSIKECEAYWMHDASIEVSKQKLLVDVSLLFLLPFLTIILQVIVKMEVPVRLFMKHFIIALTSFSAFVFAVSKPCESINGGHYMFINSTTTLIYYLLKIISLIIIGIILYRTIFRKKEHAIISDEMENG